MGWDAYAVLPGFDPNLLRESDRGADSFLPASLEDAFREANINAWLDGLCIGLLHRATGIPDYDEARKDGEDLIWSPEIVRKAQAAAQWDISLEPFQSADELILTRRFLEVCASHGLGIWFSW